MNKEGLLAAGPARVHGSRYGTRAASSGPDVRRTVGARLPPEPPPRGSCVPSAFFCVFLFFNLFGKRLARRFKRRQRMCGVGSFQHGSSSTKNSTAAPCQTILVPDVRQTERSRGEGGGVQPHKTCSSGNSASLCLSRSAKRRKKKKTVHGSLKIFPSSSSKLKRRMQLLAESCALSIPVKLPTLSCLLTSYFPGRIQPAPQM